jgi:lipopolysaccharide transport system ATP-binding protein
MPETVIKVENLSKVYKLGNKKASTFKEYFAHSLKRDGSPELRLTKAIDNITFEVKQGEALGVIGPNGSGKSTLLRILGGITKPSAGRVEITGRVASVLDIGSGFHPDLSGMDNIFLYGEMLGMKRKEIKESVSQIVEFSEIGDFIHSPVKHYSSGMFIRLAFAVIAHLDADILLLDEVLAVGDAAFQIKSYKKMQELLNSGRTIILVSHNLSSLTRYTTRCLYLENGQVAGEGRTDEIINAYAAGTMAHRPANINGEKTIPANLRVWEDAGTAPGNEYIRMRKIAVRNENREAGGEIYVDEKIVIEVEFEKLDDTQPINIALRVNDVNGNPLFATSPLLTGSMNEWGDYLTTKGIKQFICTIEANLFNSSVFVMDLFVLDIHNYNTLLSVPYIFSFTTNYKTVYGNLGLYKLANHPILPVATWTK